MTKHAPKTLVLAVSTLAVVTMTTACGDDDSGYPSPSNPAPWGDSAGGTNMDVAANSPGGGSTETRLCQRLDDCNTLTELGHFNVSECVEARVDCTGDLLPSVRSDWRSLVGDCLDLSTCKYFLECYFDTPTDC